MNKSDIRKTIYKIRKEMTEQEHAEQSYDIFNQIINMDVYKNAACIYAYCDINNEVATSMIIKSALSSGKRVALPKIVSVNGKDEMQFFEITQLDETQIKKGYFGIPEPVTEITPPAPDIVIVPGVAFSKKLQRLGYGGGFYDRFLDDSMIKIAPAFEFQLYDELPCEDHDILMDYIVTPDGKYSLNA